MIEHDEREQAATASERGAALVEYGFLVSLIAVVCLVAISFLGESTNSSFDSTKRSIELIDSP